MIKYWLNIGEEKKIVANCQIIFSDFKDNSKFNFLDQFLGKFELNFDD